ncbi:hypothetical protein P692DRAFT_20883064 [Suillus brevipes Sb2]|nr:hypothetical protein P692DRAFT_20883064 [Suillus brevipes Sb2]
MQSTVLDLLNTSVDECAFIFKHNFHNGNTVHIETSATINAALEGSAGKELYTQTPSIFATTGLYDDKAEFNRIANLIANDPATVVVYAESLALAKDLVQMAFIGELTNRA